VTSPGR